MAPLCNATPAVSSLNLSTVQSVHEFNELMDRWIPGKFFLKINSSSVGFLNPWIPGPVNPREMYSWTCKSSRDVFLDL